MEGHLKKPDDAQVGDKVMVDGLVTLMRKGAWRKTKVMEASHCTLMRAMNNGMWEVEIPDLGRCLVHRTAFAYPRPTWVSPEYQAKPASGQ